MKNYYLYLLFILAVFIFLPTFAQAYTGGHGGYNNPGMPYTSDIAHGNRYESRIYYMKVRQREYQRQLDAYHHEMKRQRIAAEKVRRAQEAARRDQMLREQRAHEIRMAQIQAQHRAAQAKTNRSKITYSRNANQERSSAVNGNQAQNGEPQNPTVIQRLRYAFTGRY